MRALRVCSPTMGASALPRDLEDLEDLELVVSDLELLVEAITPPTKEMKAMRLGNLTWRKGKSTGNAIRLP